MFKIVYICWKLPHLTIFIRSCIYSQTDKILGLLIHTIISNIKQILKYVYSQDFKTDLDHDNWHSHISAVLPQGNRPQCPLNRGAVERVYMFWGKFSCPFWVCSLVTMLTALSQLQMIIFIGKLLSSGTVSTSKLFLRCQDEHMSKSM